MKILLLIGLVFVTILEMLRRKIYLNRVNLLVVVNIVGGLSLDMEYMYSPFAASAQTTLISMAPILLVLLSLLT